VEKPIIDSAGGMGNQAEDGAGAEEGREKREQEIKAKFGCVAKKSVSEKRFPGPLDDEANGNAL
jgi:hypothetical protein